MGSIVEVGFDVYRRDASFFCEGCIVTRDVLMKSYYEVVDRLRFDGDLA